MVATFELLMLCVNGLIAIDDAIALRLRRLSTIVPLSVHVVTHLVLLCMNAATSSTMPLDIAANMYVEAVFHVIL